MGFGEAADRRRSRTPTARLPELKGGDWTRGREIFFNEKNLCVKCHQVRGRGGRIGPDLSNLIHRDYESVLRDIHSPSAAINPDYITYFVALRDGRALQGVLRTEGDSLVIGDQKGRQVTGEARGHGVVETVGRFDHAGGS